MFETAIIDQNERRGAWSFSSSLLLQCGLVGAVLVGSLMLPVALPEPPSLAIPVPFPRMRQAVQVVSTSVERQVVAVQRPRPFVYVPPTVARTAVPQARFIEAMEADLPPSGRFELGHSIGEAFPIPGPIAPPAAKSPATTQPPAPAKRQVLGGDVLGAKLILRVQPVYPPIARQARIEGVVTLHGVITREGRIAQLRVLSGPPLLVKAAVDAVMQWVYSPTLLNGQPVEVEAPIEVKFILSR